MKIFQKKILISLILLIVISAVGGYVFKNTQTLKNENAEEPACQAIKSPDGSDFDWDTINSKKEFEICLSDLAGNLESPEEMRNWLEKEGFSDTSIDDYGGIGDTNSTSVHAKWDPRSEGKLMPFKEDFRIMKYWMLGERPYRVVVTYKDGHRVDDVNSWYNTK